MGELYSISRLLLVRANQGQMMKTIAVLFGLAVVSSASLLAQETTTHRVLATSKTSTMQKEMQQAGDAGFRFAAVMGGETAVGGKEVVVVMQKPTASASKFEYRLLATNKTSTMQKEMQEGSDAGFQYVGQTVFESAFGGKEVVCILERDSSIASPPKQSYRLLATTKTSTLEKELKEAGDVGYVVVGMTVGETLVGGKELVAITRKPVK
jgi:hypothetical protein